MTEELTEQPAPEDARCPECHAAPTEESITRHRLSNLGYLHDDVYWECTECGNEWLSGIPIGEYDGGDDLWCESCGSEWMLTHRVLPNGDTVILHLKCPNDECYHWKDIERSTDGVGRALVGYPQITGSIEGCKPYGYPEGADEPE